MNFLIFIPEQSTSKQLRTEFVFGADVNDKTKKKRLNEINRCEKHCLIREKSRIQDKKTHTTNRQVDKGHCEE